MDHSAAVKYGVQPFGAHESESNIRSNKIHSDEKINMNLIQETNTLGHVVEEKH